MNNERIHEMIQKVIKNDPLVRKHLLGYAWLSGSSTEVPPVQVSGDTIELQLSTHKNVFARCIERIVEKSKGFLTSGRFVRNDGSCPSCLVFRMSEPVQNAPASGYTEDEIKELWYQFEDVPMDPVTECMESPFLHFPAGTHREEIWHWFDEHYPKGVYALLYGE